MASEDPFQSELNEQNKRRIKVKRSYAGLGLFATDTFKKGERIIEYVGKRLTSKEVDAIVSNKYLFEINKKITLDGSPRQNIARYANHSCKPNAEGEVIRGHAYIIAKKTISPGDEITWDYGKEYFNEHIGKGKCLCHPCKTGKSAATKRKGKGC